MKRACVFSAKILTGLLVSAVYALPQAYTISAKPGVVNYIEGEASINGRPVSSHNLKAVFLNANDTMATGIGKAELLLSPGVFLRLGDNSQVRMISPSLSDTQLEVKSGEAMIEADNVVKDSRVTVTDHGATMIIDRDGLYKFTAGDQPTAAVLEGKASVYFGDRKVELGKGHEVELADANKPRKFDAKKEDDLYAWSNVRAEYNAASSYQAAKDVNAAGYGGVWGGYGFSGFSNPGWLWNSGFDSWAWLPGNGIYSSPFGFGFYGPGLVGYAPVVYAPFYGGGGGGYYGGHYKRPITSTSALATSKGGGTVVTRAVPVNPVHPAAIGTVVASPAANEMARSQAAHSYASTGGFRTSTGAVVPAGRAAAASFSGSNGSGRAGSVAAAPASGGGFSGAHSSGGGISGISSAGSGGGHSSGGSSGGHH